jgi:cytochrome b561
MRSNGARYNAFFIVNHWALAGIIVILLGLAWYIQYFPQKDTQTQNFLFELHTSLGITAAILLLIQIVLRIALRPPPYPKGFPRRQIRFARASYFLIYVALVLMLGSGYLQAHFSGMAVQFWGATLPGWNAADRALAETLGEFWGAPLRIWGAADVTWAEFFGALHRITAIVLAALIAVHIGGVAINSFNYPGIAARMLPGGRQEPQDSGKREEPESPITVKIVQRLAKRLRLFGWVEFWIQLVIALISGLLLEFITSGNASNPDTVGSGNGIYWAIDGFVLLWPAIILSFSYTRAARKIVSKPDSYLTKTVMTAFWFLVAGMLIGCLGVLASVIGVVLSISLLIVKTVSQAPGQMIMESGRIVRALDVFVLIVNFSLFVAHGIGASIALWLGNGVHRARLKYISTSRRKA